MESRITIKTHHETFVNYDSSRWKEKNKVTGNRYNRCNSCIFIMKEYIDEDDEKERRFVSLKTCQNTYLSVQPNGYLFADIKEVGISEKFLLIHNEDDTYSFETYNNRYLCAEKNHRQRITANRNNIGAWERFRITFNDNNTYNENGVISGVVAGIGAVSGFGAGVLIMTGVMAQVIPGLNAFYGAPAIANGLAILGGNMMGGIAVAGGIVAGGGAVGAVGLGIAGNKIGKKIEKLQGENVDDDIENIENIDDDDGDDAGNTISKKDLDWIEKAETNIEITKKELN